MAAKTVQREVGLRGALQHQELADEVVQHGQPDAGQHGDQEDGGEPRRGSSYAAVIRDFERMPPLIEKPTRRNSAPVEMPWFSIW